MLVQLLRRVGGMVASPRLTLALQLAEPRRRGLGDLALLLGLDLVAMQLPRLARAGWALADRGVGAGLSRMFEVAVGFLMVPLAALLGGAALLWLAARGRREHTPALDLAASCMIPAVAFDLLTALVLPAVAAWLPPFVLRWAPAVGLLWYAALLAVAVWLVRGRSAVVPAPAGRPWAVGAAVFGVALVLLTLRGLWVANRCDALRGLKLGDPAPAFTLPAVDGARTTLTALRGKVVVLDFWATWCRPCVRKLPQLEQLARRLGPRGLQVVLVNVEGDRDKVARFFAARRGGSAAGRGPLVLIDDGRVAARYGVDRLPFVVVVDRRGVVRLAGGAVAGAELERRLGRLLSGKPGD